MNYSKLITVSERLKIPVYDFRMQNKKAFCTQNAIALDCKRIDTERERKQLLSEELGHVIQKAYYPLGDCCDALKLPNLMKQERKAKDYAVRLQVPLCELKTALKKSQDDYELAETLDVDLDVLSAAVEYYKRKGMI